MVIRQMSYTSYTQRGCLLWKSPGVASSGQPDESTATGGSKIPQNWLWGYFLLNWNWTESSSFCFTAWLSRCKQPGTLKQAGKKRGLKQALHITTSPCGVPEQSGGNLDLINSAFTSFQWLVVILIADCFIWIYHFLGFHFEKHENDCFEEDRMGVVINGTRGWHMAATFPPSCISFPLWSQWWQLNAC